MFYPAGDFVEIVLYCASGVFLLVLLTPLCKKSWVTIFANIIVSYSANVRVIMSSKFDSLN